MADGRRKEKEELIKGLFISIFIGIFIGIFINIVFIRKNISKNNDTY
ncbi:MAG: hypothetical protein KME64_19455 [Scytonematopsis contorta HA4267-MV1]|jgi:uncharacterized protein YneF (UPF0154 family)|nr:hypothetical protein [Scytonematopsis contorta HA4267-MV1]